MSLRSYILLMLLGTAACLSAFLAVIYFFEPTYGGLLALVLFYTSLFLTLVGIISLLGLLVRIIFTQNKLIFRKVVISFRQAVWFALIINIGLLLKSFNLFYWWSLAPLIFAMALLELFFISYRPRPKLKI